MDVQSKRKNRHTKLHVDNELQQVKIKDLNHKFNIQCLLVASGKEKHLLQNKKSENGRAEYCS